MTEATSELLRTVPGNPERRGAFIHAGGIDFAMCVPEDAKADLILITEKGKDKETVRIPLTEEMRTGDVCAVRIEDAADVCGYYYEIDGVKTADPNAASTRAGYSVPVREAWETMDVPHPFLSLDDLMIYKLHVRGFTKKAKRVRAKGTFRGTAEMIPYISELGFNAVELMPIYSFDETLRLTPFTNVPSEGAAESEGKILKNYWGYAAKNNYFAPKAAYASSEDAPGELRDMIRAFHAAGMDVLMEIYFPEHTDPYVAISVIHFWKRFYHMDGFHLIGQGVPVASIVKDPMLTRTKLLIDRVDGQWIYGNHLPKTKHFLEYNDDFEYTARAFLKGDEGKTLALSQLLKRNPATHGYVNYMACVNGMTLYDSVCYEWKHNEANGENNSDGTSWNYSWNCGVEGPSKKRSIRLLRMKQMKNALLIAFLAQGVPLLYAGDEGCNTQNGNNNAYAQDNPTGWTDWNMTKDAEELRAFVRKLTAFRKAHPVFHRKTELRGTDYQGYGCPDISFHDETAWVCSFENVSRTLAVMYNGLYTALEGLPEDQYFYVAYNAYWDAHPFALPDLPAGYLWYPAIRSFAPQGEEFTGDEVKPLPDQKYADTPPRSVTVLLGKPDPDAKAKSSRRGGKSEKKKKNAKGV